MSNPLSKVAEHVLVSVVLPFFNAESFLDEAIRSVFAQDFQQWELLLVDDGSTDGSTAIARRYAMQHPDKVVYLEHAFHRNRGVGLSRNVGVKASCGAYIAFIDADDVWLPGKLSAQLEIFRKNPAATVLAEAALYWYSWRDGSEQDIVVKVGVRQGIYKAPELMLSLYPLGKGAAPCPSGMMVKRAVLGRCAFEELFTGIFQVYEDQAFLSKIYLKETVYVSQSFHIRYRQRPASLMAELRESGNYDKVRSHFLYWLRDYLHAQPYRYRSVERLLRRTQMRYRDPLLYKVFVELPHRFRKLVMRALIKLGIINYSKSW
jgi:glycosyltransferase involved in cell wall biosynthesis